MAGAKEPYDTDGPQTMLDVAQRALTLAQTRLTPDASAAYTAANWVRTGAIGVDSAANGAGTDRNACDTGCGSDWQPRKRC